MAGKQRLELKDISNALADASWNDVKKLALELGVKKSSLDSIEEERHKVDDRKLDAMDLWLKKDVDASWEKVADALEAKGLNALAESIRAQYCENRTRSACGGATASSTGTRPKLSESPTIAQLQMLKVEGGKDLKIIEHVAADWSQIATAMDFDDTGRIQSNINANHRNVIECCKATFTTWLNGTGKKQPATWNTLIQILDDCNFKVLAEDVKKALS